MTGSPTLQAFLQLVLGKALGAAIDDEAAKQLVTHIVDATKPPATEQHASLKRLSEDFVLQTKVWPTPYNVELQIKPSWDE